MPNFLHLGTERHERRAERLRNSGRKCSVFPKIRRSTESDRRALGLDPSRVVLESGCFSSAWIWWSLVLVLQDIALFLQLVAPKYPARLGIAMASDFAFPREW